MYDTDFYASDEVTAYNQQTNPLAKKNREVTMDMISSIAGLHGRVLDIGSWNLFSGLLAYEYPDAEIFSTRGDLDDEMKAWDNSINKYVSFKFDFVHYNNVIEHQFNPLFTLQMIHSRLTDNGILILGTPCHPNWITPARCHFHEMDWYRLNKLLNRAGFVVTAKKHFHRPFSLRGIRGLAGSFYTRQVVLIAKKSKL